MRRRIDNREDGNPAGDVIVCQGPPLCLLEGDAAEVMQKKGCLYCERIFIDEDGNERSYNPALFMNVEWVH